MKTKKILSLLVAITILLICFGITAMAEETGVAKIGDNYYATFDEALKAANTMTGDVTIEIYDKVTLNKSLLGSYSSITFAGMEDSAEIYLDVQGYITAQGKNVAFEDLTLSKSEGGFITNAGFMNVAFGIYDVKSVSYKNCIFANGAYASSGKNTFTNCIFKRSHDKYGLWAYGNVETIVDSCTFADYRGIKMYAEDKAKTTDLTVKNTNFTDVTDKPAIVLTYGESVTLENNTYSSTGVFELDIDGAPNGTTVTSDVAPTCKNDNGACGVLVDGKIYTTVAQAVEVAVAGSKVTLLHDSSETVEFVEGVILNKNGFTAENVKVEGNTSTTAVAKIGDTTYATLEAAFTAATEGQTIALLADATPALTSQRAITKAAVIDLNGKTLTLTEDDLYFGTTTFKEGNIVVAPSVKASTAVFWMFKDQTLTFDNVKITATGVTGTYLIGINGETGSAINMIDSEIIIDNTSIAGLTAVICDNGTNNSVKIENSDIDVKNIEGRFYLGGKDGDITVKNSDIDLNGVKEGFLLRANQTLNIEGTSNVTITLNDTNGRYGINLADTATYTKAETATVNATTNAPVAPELPNATVSKRDPLTLTAAEHKYMVWPSGDTRIDRPLEIVMNFKANDTLEECLAGGFSDWLVDFNLKFTGLSTGSITADNCYLAGNYGTFGWIVIPTDGKVLKEGETYPVVSAYDATLNYKDICKSVKDFTAAIHVDQAILDANPNFTVELTLVMTNPKDASQKLTIGEPAIYTAADLKNEEEETLDTITSYVRNIVTKNANNEDRYQVILFAGIDSLDYDSVGFEITVQGETREQSTKTVYTSYTAAGVTYTPSQWGEDCKYIFALPINFRPELKAESVTYRPFAVTLDGKKLWGPEKTIDKIYNK